VSKFWFIEFFELIVFKIDLCFSITRVLKPYDIMSLLSLSKLGSSLVWTAANWWSLKIRC